MRVSHAGNHRIAEHRHDWPTLTVHLAGAFTERLEGGHVRIAGPAAIFLPAGHSHADAVDPIGLETFGIVFDPAWLRLAGCEVRVDEPRCWLGGAVAGKARQLASTWSSVDAEENGLARATGQFFETALGTKEAPPPSWLEHALEEIDTDPGASTFSVSKRLGLNAAWFARAYRAALGEGLRDTLRRKKVERALLLLKTTELPLVDIAIIAGFCDQAHMNRCFKSVLRQTPREVRRGAEKAPAV